MGLGDAISVSAPGNVAERKIYINESELSNEITVNQVVVNKTFNKIASAKLVLMDGTVASRDFVLSNDDKFKPGSKIRIDLGFDDDLETIFEGIIIKHSIKIRQEGSSLLLIEAKDIAIKLTGARKNAYFIGKTDSDVIESLAGESVPSVDPTDFTHKQLIQFDATDWDFIVTRAEANGMFVLTDDGKLVVKKPTLDDAVMTATYGDNIWEFEGEMDARRHAKNIIASAWDYTSQSAESSEDGESDFTDAGNLDTGELGDVMGTSINLSHTGYLTQDQLQDWADAYELRSKISKTSGRVRVIGNAAVKPGDCITLDGVGDRFNGDVMVTGILHQYDGNWQTDIQFGWREDWFYKKEEVINSPASGLLPGVNGLQIGVVLDTVDKEEGGQYRIKVHVPMFNSGNEGLWARVATLDAGPGRGIYFRPQKDDEVILGFLNDDPREPIIVGYLHSKDSRKSPLPETEGNLEYGFVTKEKLKLVFDDTNKKMLLEVPAGTQKKTIIINDSSGAIELKDENQNSIKMDSLGITIQAGSGKNVIIKGTMVKIN